jgi:hypothetical protein
MSSLPMILRASHSWLASIIWGHSGRSGKGEESNAAGVVLAVLARLSSADMLPDL